MNNQMNNHYLNLNKWINNNYKKIKIKLNVIQISHILKTMDLLLK